MPYIVKLGRCSLVSLFTVAISIATSAQTTGNHSCDALLMRSAPKPTVYFPTQLFSDLTVEWYARELSTMREPSLNQSNCSPEIYRFLWLRSFHAPVAIRAWTSAGKHFLVAKMRHGNTYSRPGRFVTTRVRRLSDEEWVSFKTLLNQISFWNLTTDERSEPNPDGSVDLHFDGAEWLIEGFRDGTYHVTDRWSPKGQYRETCLYLLKLSRLPVRTKEIY